jgi:hypothetical protein
VSCPSVSDHSSDNLRTQPIDYIYFKILNSTDRTNATTNDLPTVFTLNPDPQVSEINREVIAQIGAAEEDFTVAIARPWLTILVIDVTTHLDDDLEGGLAIHVALSRKLTGVRYTLRFRVLPSR